MDGRRTTDEADVKSFDSPGSPAEISVKVSDEEQTLTQKYLRYENDIRLSHDCPHMQEMVKETVDKFKGTPTDVIIKIKYTW